MATFLSLASNLIGSSISGCLHAITPKVGPDEFKRYLFGADFQRRPSNQLCELGGGFLSAPASGYLPEVAPGEASELGKLPLAFGVRDEGE